MKYLAPSLSLVLLLHGGFARCQTSEMLVRRQRLLDQLAVALRDGQHESALRLALEAGDIRMSPSIRMYIAEEHYTLQHAQEALESASLCLTDLSATPNVNSHAQIHERCQQVVANVTTRNGALYLRLPAPRPRNLRIWVAQQEIDPHDLARPIYRPAGPVQIEATAENGLGFRRAVILSAGQDTTVEVTLERAPPAPSERGPSPVTSPGAGPWVVVGVGGVSLAVATILYAGPYQSAEAELNENQRCVDGVCPGPSTPRLLDANRRARLYGPLGWSLFGVGTAAVVSGLIWYVVDRTRMPSAPSTAVVLLPTSGGVTFSLTRTF